ncbi:MAG: hypothetical protein EAY72_00105 [Bacteroidetes bacterium]|nr:MAG: hypothetical protein EAY72_00105 [Bacteroidota bacterium]
MDYLKIRQKPAQFKALTSLTIEEFDELAPLFEAQWLDFIQQYTLDGQRRSRRYKPVNETQLPTPAHKLFFVLIYEKTNPLQEYHAASFDIDVSMTNKWIHVLSPLLNKATQTWQASRQEIMTTEQELVVDVTERPIQRGLYEQKQYYSGKKKTHTVKNLVLCTTLGLIVFLGQTALGRIHDKRLAEAIVLKKGTRILADLGFLGWRPIGSAVSLPHKKPKGKELTDAQKEANTAHSSRRVIVEHVFSSVKIMRIVKDRNRNYRFGYRDLVFQTACSLHNYRWTKRKHFEQKLEKIG